MIMKKLYTILVALLLLVSNSTFCQPSDKNNRIMESFIQKGMIDWEIPGLAVAIVKNGKLVFQEAYGVRELGKKDPVDINTIFSIASTTKAITVACLGILVDEEKLNWDDPVIKHFPEFRLKDSYITKNLTVRDLLTHRAGMPNTDLFWITPNFDKEEIFRRMELIDPAYSFRSSYTYQNIMYAVAGEVVARVSGVPWHQFVNERIFTPLGMTYSVPLMSELPSIENKVTPHYIIEGKPETIVTTSTDPVAPAGSIWSSIGDMSKWLAFMLDSANVNGKRLLSASTYSEILKPNHIIPKNSFYSTTALTKPNWTTYGLGWFQHDYRGKMVEFHTGSIGGLIAIVGMIPSEKIGVCVLANMDHAELRHAIMYKSFDLYAFNDNSRDWHQEIFNLYKGSDDAEAVQDQEKEDSRVEGTKTSLEKLDSYAGVFEDGIFGKIDVTFSDEELVFNFNETEIGRLTHWHYDTFKLIFSKKYWGSSFINFNLNPEGDIEELEFFGITWMKKN
jgi:CubicO group peptidase (beta-lactamase class C family)